MLTRPNSKTHIALLYKSFTKENYEHSSFKEILDLIEDNAFNLNYNYSIYADYHEVQEHIFLPIFHTYYLNSEKKNVIILSNKMYDIPELYPYHNYYLYGDKETTKEDYELLTKAHPNIKFTQINSIKEMIEHGL